jgi:hypothetical protein
MELIRGNASITLPHLYYRISHIEAGETVFTFF